MRLKRINPTRLGAAMLVASVLCLAAPGARAQKAADVMAEDRQGFRTSILEIKGQIGTTLKALDGIVQATDSKARKSALKTYSDEVKAMGKEIETTRDYAKKMKEKGQAYFKEWEKKMKPVTNETLRASAEKRRAEISAQYEKIESGIAQAKEDSARFWQNVQDLEKFFMNDLSNEAVTDSATLVASTKADGSKIQGYIDQVVKAVDEVGKRVEKAEEVTPMEEEPGEAEPGDAEEGNDPGLL